MTRPAVEPTKGTTQHGQCDPHDTYSHDAFGVITLTEHTGGSETLFGSDLKHSGSLCIAISRATLERNLSNDWIHGGRRELIEICMSHAQFAQFITSPGKGCGTPVTIRYFNGDEMPGIKNIESKAEVLQREIYEASKRQIANLSEMINKLGAMLATGKVGIKEARELHHSMTCAAGNLPSNMEYVVEQGRAAVLKAQSDAMIELEAYGNNVARRMGVESFQRLAEVSNASLKQQQIEGEK